CGRRPLLHGLKEAPELFRMAIPFTGANLVTRRATETVAEVISSLLIYGASGLPCLAGCGLHCRQALLPRDRKPAPETQCLVAAPAQCVTLTAQSGKVTHAALSTCTRKLNCASSWLDSDTAFSGHLTNKENMNRYRGGSGRSGG
ncbi:hypothetical protein ACVRBD_004527, partial [Salmonella enterica subsp. enterica]